MQYTPTEKELEELERQFTYHKPKEGQPERYVALRALAKKLGLMILEECPPSRERSLARTHLEDVVMWANASIARNE